MMPAEILNQYQGDLKLNHSMSQYTSLRVGGPADRFYVPVDLHDLSLFLESLEKNEPLYWLGLGSNLLVRDGGIRGTVIATKGALANIRLTDSGTVYVEAGVTCAKAARFCAQHDLLGAEFFAGIPGTVGGALAMNAGAFGGETWQIVSHVNTMNRCGEINTRSVTDFDIGYRDVKGAVDEWFVSAELTLLKADADTPRQSMKSLLAERNQKQPIGLPSCGSVFRNPDNAYSAVLIEQSGLKGFCIGQACVSEKHANFIINTGGASAADIEKLIQHIVAVVSEKQQIHLVPEVHIIGEAS